MKRLWRVFELTVAEQRVVVVVLLGVVGFVGLKTYRQLTRTVSPAATTQPSPSPGILP